jgi:hypothetical protein
LQEESCAFPPCVLLIICLSKSVSFVKSEIERVAPWGNIRDADTKCLTFPAYKEKINYPVNFRGLIRNKRKKRSQPDKAG